MEQTVQAPLAFLCVFAPSRESYLMSECKEAHYAASLAGSQSGATGLGKADDRAPKTQSREETMEQAVQAPLAFLCVFAPLRESYLTSEADDRAQRRKAAKRRWSKQFRHHSPSFASLRLRASLI